MSEFFNAYVITIRAVTGPLLGSVKDASKWFWCERPIVCTREALVP